MTDKKVVTVVCHVIPASERLVNVDCERALLPVKRDRSMVGPTSGSNFCTLVNVDILELSGLVLAFITPAWTRGSGW